MKICDHLVKAALCLLLVFSPIGAPLIGMFALGVCPVDATVHPDGPFSMDATYCGISRPVELLYEQSVFLPLTSMLYFGQSLGGLLALVWWLSGIAVASRCVWHVWQAVSAMTIGRA